MLRQFQLSLFLAVLIFVGNGSAGAQNPPAPGPLDQQTNAQLAALAGRVLKHANAAACHQNNCTILVANFVDSSGSTSVLGTQLADALSAQLALQANGIKVVERSTLRNFLEQERMPSQLLDDRALSWLASRLSASAVVIGRLEKEKKGVSLRIQLRNAQNAKKGKGKPSYDEKLVLAVQDADRFLAPAEPFGEAPHVDATPQGEKIYRAGTDTTAMPSCDNHPDPGYSDAAREAKFQGTLLLEVTIRSDGNIGDIQVLRGAPFGLNDQARKTVAGWKCKPALLNGTPVATRVPIEVMYRLF
jgi:TonB family protein